MSDESSVTGDDRSMLQLHRDSLLPLAADLHLHVWRQKEPSLDVARQLLVQWWVAFVPNC